MVNKLKCGHPVGWMIRLNDNGTYYKYCLGCLFEKVGLKQIKDYVNPEVKPEVKDKPKKKKEN